MSRETSPEELRRRIESAIKRTETVNQKKAALGGQLKAKREELAALVEEIKAAKLDPKNLKPERDKVQAELYDMLVGYEKKLADVEAALASFETARSE
jgi:chromosome segregation ATPase